METSSLMLVDDIWTHGLREYAHDPVVAIPARDVLAFCDGGVGPGLDRAACSSVASVAER
jgi:hypothetical protein